MISQHPTSLLVTLSYKRSIVSAYTFSLFSFISLFTSIAVAVEPSNSLKRHNEGEAHLTRVEVVDDSLLIQGKNEPLNDENSGSSSIERFVQPFTRWAEDQIHDAGLIRSPQVQENTTLKQQGALTLREAIKHATRQYPGTVLSANKVKSGETLSFQIKIISAQGVVKTIKITKPRHDNQNDDQNDDKESQ